MYKKKLGLFRLHVCVSALCMALHGISLPAVAQQTSPPNIDRERDLLEKQALQRRIEQELLEQLEPAPHEAETSRPQESAQVDSARLLVTRIVVLNDERTSGGYASVVNKYVGTYVGSDEVIAILRDLTNYYAGLGYSTTTVTLSNQRIDDGVLEFRVNWGFIEGWLIDGQGPRALRDRWMVNSGLPGWKGKVLNIHDIDQAVENLSNVAKVAQIQVIPSEQIAYSYLNLAVTPQRGLSASLDVDNSGSENQDGYYKANGQVTIADLLGVNDSLTLGAGVRFFDAHSLHAERNAMASMTIPWGRWSGSLSYSHFKYRNVIDGKYGAYVTKGQADDVKARLARVISRNQTGKTTVWTELNSQDSENFVAGYRIESSSRRYSNFGLGISKAGKLWGGAAYGDVVWSRGVGWLDSYAQYSGQPGALDPLYTRWTSNLSWTRGLGQTRRWQYNARAGLQYSADTLLGANQFNLGDEFTVRGFKGNGISAERGVYLANTLSYTFSVPGGGWFQTLTPSLGFDVGSAKSDSVDAKGHRLSGTSIGLRASGRALSASALWGMPLQTAPGERRAPVLYLRAALAF